MALDLHGTTIHNGWKTFVQEADDAYYRRVKAFKVITGKGEMLREFPVWASNHPRVREAKLNIDGGSYKVVLHKHA